MSNKDLIEASQVPDLERLAIQEMLNAMTRGGELNGPPIREDGRDSQVYQERLRERDARFTILGTQLTPARPPDPAAHEAAKAEDEGQLALVRGELAFIPAEIYMGSTPRKACEKKLHDLEEIFRRKWDPAAAVVAEIEQLLGAPPEAGSLLARDGRFEYAGVDHHMALLRGAELSFEKLPVVHPERIGCTKLFEAYRLAILAGLGATQGVAAAKPVAAAPVAKPALPPRPPGPPRPLPPRVAVTATPAETEQQAFEAWCIEVVALLEFDERAALLAQLEADGASLDDRRIGYLATSLALERPEALSPELADRLDERGLKELASQVEIQPLSGLSRTLRLGIVKQLSSRVGASGDARGGLAGAFAAAMVKADPKSLAELLEQTTGDNRASAVVGLTKHLREEDLVSLPRETVHAIYRAIGSPVGDEARRQSARLVRLANKK